MLEARGWVRRRWGRVTAAILLVAAVGVAAVVGRTAVGAGATALSIHVSGNTLVDGNGNPIRVAGVNYSGPEYACVQGWGIFDGPSDAATVQALVSWHMQIVRIPLNEDCWLNINGVPAAYAGSNYINAIVGFVNLLHSYGIYAELSLIWGAPGSNPATYQPGAPDEDHSPAMWASMAKTFAGDPAVILAPWGETTLDWSCFLNGGTCEATYGRSNTPYPTAGMQQAVTVMRGAGYNGVISIPCIDYANDCADSSGSWLTSHPSDTLTNPQLIAEAHIYGNNTCGAQNGGACLTQTIAPLANKVPVIFGETGETYDDSECTSANMQVILPWAEAHSVSYEAWTWDTWGNCDALISNFNGTPNTTAPQGAAYGTYVHDHLVSANPAPTPPGATTTSTTVRPTTTSSSSTTSTTVRPTTTSSSSSTTTVPSTRRRHHRT
jgi:hypothetical protein